MLTTTTSYCYYYYCLLHSLHNRKDEEDEQNQIKRLAIMMALTEDPPLPGRRSCHVLFLLLHLDLLLLLLLTAAELSQAQVLNFYAVSCPRAESTVTAAVTAAVRKDPTLAPALLRLVFHDCFVEVKKTDLSAACSHVTN